MRPLRCFETSGTSRTGTQGHIPENRRPRAMITLSMTQNRGYTLGWRFTVPNMTEGSTILPLHLISPIVRVWLHTCSKTSCLVLGTTHLARFYCCRRTGNRLSVFPRTFEARVSVASHSRIRRVCIPTWTARGVAVIHGLNWTSWLTPALTNASSALGDDENCIQILVI